MRAGRKWVVVAESAFSTTSSSCTKPRKSMPRPKHGCKKKCQRRTVCVRRSSKHVIKGGRKGRCCIICNRKWIRGWEKFTIKMVNARKGIFALKGGKHGRWCADEHHTKCVKHAKKCVRTKKVSTKSTPRRVRQEEGPQVHQARQVHAHPQPQPVPPLGRRDQVQRPGQGRGELLLRPQPYELLRRLRKRRPDVK